MKKGDFFWLAGLAAFIAILVVPVTHEMFVKFTTEHAYMGGFIKFFKWSARQNDFRTFCMSEDTKKVYHKLEEIVGVR